jgi:ABC-2 type transport system permease protein
MYLATYARYWRINLLTMLEYRANFIMWGCFTLIYHATALVALWVTLKQFPAIEGWDFKQTAFMYGLWMLGHAVNNTFFFTVGSVPEFVREGRFDRFLVRPLDPLFQTLTTPQQIWPDELILAIIYICIVTPFAGVHVDPLFLAYVPLVALGGACIDFGINLVISTVSFWFTRVDSLRWVVMSMEQDFSRYPLAIYQRGVRLVLAFILPFAFMNYFPATFLLHKSENGLHLNPAIGLLTPLVGLAVLAVGYAFWRVGIDRYQGTGS